MSLSKYRFKFPLLNPEELRGVDMEYALQEIKFSRNCLAIIQPHGKPVEVFLTDFNEDLLSSLVVMLNANHELYQFLKMAIFAKEQLEKNYKKGEIYYEKITAFVDQSFRHVDLQQ
jgi:hypothetical protein